MQTHVQYDDQAVNVKQRQDAEQPVVSMKVIQPVHLAHVRDQIVVSKHHAFRQTSSAAGIRQRYQILARIYFNWRNVAVALQERIERCRIARCAKNKEFFGLGMLHSCAGLLNKLRRADEKPGAGIFQLVLCFCRRVERIQGRIDAAEHRHCMKNHRVLRTVRAEDAKDIALPESPLRQARGHAPH